MEKPLPIVDDLTRPYWDAAREGRLLVQRCNGCGRHQWYPRVLCTACHGTDLAYVEAAGTGRLHAFSVVEKTPNIEFADDLPYVLAIIELDEGVRVAANIVDVPQEELRCELPLRVVFRPTADSSIVLPCFTGATR